MTEQLLPTDITNKNFTKSNNYRFQLRRTPHLNYFCQEVATPSIVGNRIGINTRYNQHFVGGDKLDYNTLSLTFKVDEDLENYQEIFDWLVGIHSPQSSDQYKQLVEREDRFIVNANKNKTEHNIMSDGSLFILTNHLNSNLIFNFVDMFPISLSGINFSTKETSELEATVEFSYNWYYIDKQT